MSIVRTATVALCTTFAVTVPSSASAAGATEITYTDKEKSCSSYTVDGQRQKQCRVDVTVRAAGVEKGDVVTLVLVDDKNGFTNDIGSFEAKRKKAKKRFKDVVCSFGPKGDLTKVPYYVTVTDPEGELVHKTKRTTLC